MSLISSLVATNFHLNLLHNKITGNGAESIGEALKHNNTLTHLHFWRNEIGNEGAISFGEALKYNTSLIYLNLGHNRIKDEGVKSLGEDLKHNNTLIELDLRGNRIEDKGKKILRQIEGGRLTKRLQNNKNLLIILCQWTFRNDCHFNSLPLEIMNMIIRRAIVPSLQIEC